MHHFKGNARFDEGLVPAKSIVLHLRVGMPVAVVPGRLLRVHQSDSREGPLVRKVRLIFFRPEIDLLNTLKPTLVVECAGEFAAPRAHTISNSVQKPDADFSVAGNTILPAVRFLQADTEESNHRLVAHGGAILLRRLANEPRRGQAMASLAVGGKHRRASAGFQRIQRSQRTAAIIRNNRRLGVNLADLRVPYIEQTDEPLLPPSEVSAANRALLTGRTRQIEAGGILEIGDTVLAIAHA